VTGKAYWATHTTGVNNRACTQKDGDFVAYNSANKALWYTRTDGMGSLEVTTSWFEHQVVLNGTGTDTGATGDSGFTDDNLVWQSTPSEAWTLDRGQTIHSPDGKHSLSLQTDGNLVLRNSAGTPTWNSHTAGSAARKVDSITVNGTCDLAIDGASPTSVIWHAVPNGAKASPGCWEIDLQNDGNLVMYAISAGAPPFHNVATWSTVTAGK
jgi:hypothetical protein